MGDISGPLRLSGRDSPLELLGRSSASSVVLPLSPRDWRLVADCVETLEAEDEESLADALVFSHSGIRALSLSFGRTSPSWWD